MEFDYSKLRGRIVEKYGNATKMAKAMGIAPVNLSNRLCGRYEFNSTMIMKMAGMLCIQTDDIPQYFFKLKV